jgi:spore photoproduct lyase
MFERIFIEHEMLEDPKAQAFLAFFPKTPVFTIDRIDEVFNRVKKPYLQKRSNLQAFLGRNRGNLVKEAPDAYGVKGEPHYYFVHSYNCIYECQYCYLQGYFHSPDLVFFLNHQEMMNQIKQILLQHSDCEKVWFHAGEFSDSLSLSHLTGELEVYHQFLKDHPQAMMELRTKSVNIKELKKLPALKNLITTFSLATHENAKRFDLKTPSLKARLKAIQELHQLGHPIGIHFDPVIYGPSFEQDYRELFHQLSIHMPLQELVYLSLGVVRFTKDVYHQVEKNYPDSDLLKASFKKSFDGKIRYSRPVRLWMLQKLKSLALEFGMKEEQIYLCMEQEDRMTSLHSIESQA